MRRRIAIIGGVAVLAAAIAVTVAFASGRGGSSHPDRIVVSDSACAPNWKPPRSGRTVFTIENTSKVATYDVELAGNNHVSVYGQVERLAPQTSDTLDAILPPGDYTFECAAFGGGTLDSDIATVTGPKVSGARPFTPVDSNQMHLVTLAYRKSLLPWLARLQRDTDALTRAVDAGQTAKAKTLWLPAHLDYARLGAAYDTFGPYNDLINGRPLGLPKGVHDPQFHGFLRLEYGLWHGQPRAELAPVANALDQAVHGLKKNFHKLPMANGDVALRTHEILENTLQFELTGETDEGSHTNLDTAWANVQGTQLSLAAVAPLLSISSPGLVSKARRGLARLEATLAVDRQQTLSTLPQLQRERLDGQVSSLLETLELVPDQLEIVEARGTNGQDPDG